MSNSNELKAVLWAHYSRENTCCLPPGAVARFERGGVSDVAVSPNGNLVAVGSHVGVWLYDAHTEDFVSLITAQDMGLLSVIAFSPDSTRIAAGDWDGKTILFDLSTRAAIFICIHKSRVNSITFSSDGRFIVTGSGDATATLWDVETGTARFTIKHQDVITSTAFSPDDKLIAVGSGDATATLWDVDTAEIRWAFTHEKQGKSVTFASAYVKTFSTGGIGSIAFSEDGKYFVTAGQRMDYATVLWDVETGEQRWCVTHEKPIDAVAFSPDSLFMAAFHPDTTVSILDVVDGTSVPPALDNEKWIDRNRVLPPLKHRQNSGGWYIRFSSDGKHLAGLRKAFDSLTLWDIGTGEIVKTFGTGKGKGRSLAFSVKGDCFGLSCTDYPQYDTIELWDEKRVKRFAHGELVDTAELSPDGTFLATGGRNKKVKLWCVETQRCYQTLSGHIGRILSLAFSPDGNLLASGGGDNWEKQEHADGRVSFFSAANGSVDTTTKVWEVGTGKNIATLEIAWMVRGVAFSPNGAYLATGTSKVVTLWCTKTWRSIAKFDTVKFESFAFSADSSHLAIGGTWPEQQVQIWDVENRELLVELSGHKSDVESLAFSPDNQLLASGGFDGVIYLWDMTPYL